MKRILLILTILALVAVPASAATSSRGEHMQHDAAETRIRIIWNTQEVIVSLFDSPVSKDFLLLLPMTVTFEDFARAEKVARLPRKLATQGGLSSSEAQGDFTYYMPWGNLAVFYRGFGNDPGLSILGRIVSGKEALASMGSNFTAKIERYTDY